MTSTFKAMAVAMLILISTVAWGDEWVIGEATSGYSMTFNVEADDGTVYIFKPTVECNELATGYEKREWTPEEWEEYRDGINGIAVLWDGEIGYERIEIVEESCQLIWEYVGRAK